MVFEPDHSKSKTMTLKLINLDGNEGGFIWIG